MEHFVPKICSFFILFCVAAVQYSAAQGTIETLECATMRYHLSHLNASVERLCSAVTDSEDNQALWIPLEPVLLGDFLLTTTSTQNFTIPYAVPHTANEVLIYIYIRVYLHYGYSTYGLTDYS